MGYHALSCLNQTFQVPEKYKFIKEIGQGAYGIVCAAENTKTGEQCAIKKVCKLFERPILTKRALRELKLLEHFNGHKNIIRLFDMDIVDYNDFNEIYLFQELMEADLHQIIRSGQPLTDEHFQSFIYQACCGLKYIHSANVLHRDLKPCNLLVNTKCELKICDFGLARGYVDPKNGEGDTGFMTEYVATRWYRAPEIMLSFRNYTKAIDVWSLGCIFAELLGNKPLFKGRDFVDQLNQILYVLGTPDDDTLNRIGSERAQTYIKSLERFEKIPIVQLYPTASPTALDLLEKLLSFDPMSRIDVQEALEHPYFELFHDPDDEPAHSNIVDFSFECLNTVNEIKETIIEEVKMFKARRHSLKLDMRGLRRHNSITTPTSKRIRYNSSSAANDTSAPEVPLRVNALRVLGTESTRNSFLNSLTGNVFKASTTEQVLEKVNSLATQLQKHEIFDEIKIYLDTNREIPDTVDITLHLKEKDKGLFQTKLNVGNNQAELNGGVGVRNLFGGAEYVSANFSFGNRTKAAVEGILETPFCGNANTKIGIFVNGSMRDHSQINAFKESAKSTGIRFEGWTSYGKHQVSYVMTDRDITALSTASASVRSQSGSNQKQSVCHSFVRDQRDSATLATKGHFIGIYQELAGLGGQGDTSFIKHELNASLHQSLLNKGDSKIIFSTSVRAGLFTSILNGQEKGPNVSDRFYLGGPLSVRGFKMGGIGEREGNDALGGEGYWAAGASLISSIPGLSHLPVKAHAFANAGSIVTKTEGVSFEDTVKTLSETPRTSVGLGLIFHHSIARIELNYCIPLRYNAKDLPEPKFQFGFGLNFL